MSNEAPTAIGVTRMKVAFVLVSVSFAASCVGLWMMMRVQIMLLVAHFPKRAVLGDLPRLCLTYYGWLPFLGIPALVYAAWVSFRGAASVERLCLFASVLALVFVVLFFTAVVAGMLCGVPVFDAIPK
jgi:hypothetical protein